MTDARGSLLFGVCRRAGSARAMLYVEAPLLTRAPHEVLLDTEVRFRTVGDITCIGAVRSAVSS